MLLKIKEYLERLPSEKRKIMLIFSIGILAVILIVASDLSKTDKNVNKDADTTTGLDSVYEEELEARLGKIISEIENVGRVRVMVKTASGEKNEYAVNDTVNYGSSGDKKSENEYVIVKNQNNESGVIIKKDYPEIQGVMIVCDGGNLSTVKNEVTNAVSAVLGISTDRISVSKMKYTED